MVLVYWALTALLVLLVLRAVLSWFPPGGALFEQVNRIAYVSTEWMLAPVRRVVPPLRLGGVALDLSFMVVFVVILLLQGLVAGL
jgi:YggT family protein